MWGSLSGKAATAAGVAVLRWSHSESQGRRSEMGFRLSPGGTPGSSVVLGIAPGRKRNPADRPHFSTTAGILSVCINSLVLC